MKYFCQYLLPTSYFQPGCKVLSRFIHSSLLSEDVNRSFQKALPAIINNVKNRKKYLSDSKIDDKIHKASKLNMKNAKNIGSVTFLHAYNTLTKNENVSAESLEQAYAIAWAVEMVHSHNLILADKRNLQSDEQNIDKSPSSDADLLHSFLYIMLENLVSSTSYKDFLQLYNKAFMYNALARHIELDNSSNSNKYLNFNEQHYSALCEYKTAYQSFTLPLSLAMKLANISDETLCANVTKLCSTVGKLYQMKKEYNDCFGGEAIIGTGGSDIQLGKCTWLAVSALERFTARQRAVFGTCYGDAGPAHVERVKLMYKQVGLAQLFRERQTAMCNKIKLEAQELEKGGLPSEIFLKLVDAIVCDNDVRASPSNACKAN